MTAEEHQVNGGLGELVARTVAEVQPVPMGIVAVDDRFSSAATAARSGAQIVDNQLLTGF